MSFSTLPFLFYFLPAFLAVYYIVPARFRNAVLALGSLLFYWLGAGAFYGLRPASTALITAAGLVVVRETFWLTGGVLFWQGTVLAAVLLVLTRWVRQTKNWHPIVFIGLSALVGVVFRFAGA